MHHHIKLSDIMTTDLITVHPHDLFTVVDRIFKTHDFHHLPVVKDGQLVGIISKSDYRSLFEPLCFFREELYAFKNKRFFSSLLAENVMTKNVARLHPDDPASMAADLFRENLFHAIPIDDEQEYLIGMVTTFDLINRVYQQPSMVS